MLELKSINVKEASMRMNKEEREKSKLLGERDSNGNIKGFIFVCCVRENDVIRCWLRKLAKTVRLSMKTINNRKNYFTRTIFF